MLASATLQLPPAGAALESSARWHAPEQTCSQSVTLVSCPAEPSASQGTAHSPTRGQLGHRHRSSPPTTHCHRCRLLPPPLRRTAPSETPVGARPSGQPTWGGALPPPARLPSGWHTSSGPQSPAGTAPPSTTVRKAAASSTGRWSRCSRLPPASPGGPPGRAFANIRASESKMQASL